MGKVGGRLKRGYLMGGGIIVFVLRKRGRRRGLVLGRKDVDCFFKAVWIIL